MEDLILIRYGELNTKGKNRKFFINKLESNILRKLKHSFPNVSTISRRDRMYLLFKDYDVQSILNELKDVFGIQSFSLAKKVETDYQVIEDSVMEIIDFSLYQTFKVRTKRAYKQFEYDSDTINRKIATRVLKNTDLRVKMKEYDLEINIEVHEDYTYIFFDKIKGAGGYPVGISGKGLLMLSGGIDSPVAGYLTLKRGVSLDIIHFASPPYTSQKALDKVIELSKHYLNYMDKVVIYNIPFTQIQLEINKYCDASYSMTLLRRMMYRVSEKLAENKKASILVNGESIAQVASQTLESMALINEVVKMPVIRPLACFDKLEIIDIAKKIGTYETSILPYEDCCTIFLPSNPIIKPSAQRVYENEERFDWQVLIDEAVENAQRIVITPDYDNEDFKDLF